MRPVISVITAVHNDADYLQESIASIRSQNFGDFEFLIVDDASLDHSLRIIKQSAHQDKRIRVFSNNQNIGLTLSLNFALKKARGQYIARQDADDLSLPQRLTLQYQYLEKHPAIFLLGTSAIMIDARGQTKRHYRLKDNPEKITKKLTRYNSIFHSSIMFRNTGVRYRKNFYYAQDYDLYLRLLTNECQLSNLPQFLLKHRDQANSITRTMGKQQKMFAQKAREFYYQRIKTGKDRYAVFNPQTILNNG